MKLDWQKIRVLPTPARLGLFLLGLLLVWLPVAAPLSWLLRDRPNLLTIVTMGLLFIEFMIWVQWWGRKVYGNHRLLSSYGLVKTRQNGIDFANGLAIGLIFTILFFIIAAALDWLNLTQPESSIIPIVMQGLLSGVGVAFAEETVFRGWLLYELQHDYRAKIAYALNAIIFASLHFIRPVAEMVRMFPAFPGLILLGLTLILAKRVNQGRLGMAIGLHGGLVWGYYIFNVGQLVTYSPQIAPWLVGVDGNPLAGLLGLLLLSAIALWLYAMDN